jgi:uncharacterized protein
MRIALLSDTHDFMDLEILEHCQEADEIWHAGDIGSRAVMTQLESLKKPVIAVSGNIDNFALQLEYPEDQQFSKEGVSVWMRHIVGHPKRYNPEILEILRDPTKRPKLLICGHSHILEIARDAFGVLYINPGAVGHHGVHSKRTMVRFSLDQGSVKNVEAIDFGTRGRKKK